MDKEVKFTHLQIFGCVAYVHIDLEKRDKLDAKALKCYFFGYGSDKFRYRFWDDKNRKILRHCNVTFDENVLYKDKSGVLFEDAKEVRTEVELQEISLSDVAVRPQENPENNVAKSEQQLVTPALVLRRSTRATKSPERYSPSLYYLLLTDGGESESFDEAF